MARRDATPSEAIENSRLADKLYERETSIVYNDLEPMAHIRTARKQDMKLLNDHPQAVKVDEYRDEDGGVTGMEFDVPKSLIVIR